MRFKPALFFALLVPAFCATVSPSVCAQETYRIVNRDAVGDVEQVTEDFSMNMTIKASAGGQEKPFDISSHEKEKYREEVLNVDAQGRVMRLRRAYSVYHTVEKNSDGDKTKTSSLQGKTVRLERKNDKVLVTAENGTVSDEDKATLQDSSMSSAYNKIFPDHAVAIGDEWTPDNKALLKTFKGADKLTIHCKLVEITEVGGHKSARFLLSMEVSMPRGSGLVMVMKLEGEGFQALDIQRPLSLNMEGPITASGQETKDGTTITYSGQGTTHIKITADWEKVAGRPVANPRPQSTS